MDRQDFLTYLLFLLSSKRVFSATGSGFRSGTQRGSSANRVFRVQRPFPVGRSTPRTTWVQGLSHAVPKIKVAAQHPAGLAAPFLAVPL